MASPVVDAAGEIRAAVKEFEVTDDLGVIIDRVRAVAAAVPTDRLKEACAAFIHMPEVVIPAYERIVSEPPDDAQALVILANAYWLTGRGPDVVGDLATRAIAADAGNRGAWHLWALAESDPRARTERWEQVTQKFPRDQVARAALADNAASLAGAEHDPLALDKAIRTYEGLLTESSDPTQRAAIETALKTLRAWKL
ncbi:MAG TPA: hypothetical protein VFK16_10000 [Gemmatimonadaceae bacterium]|jgi:hypothetical protein|nr:hypothetical protein [Gemmatimonadaceae bacterium]